MTQQKHSPDGKKRCGADAASLGGPLVMQVIKRRSAPLNGREMLRAR